MQKYPPNDNYYDKNGAAILSNTSAVTFFNLQFFRFVNMFLTVDLRFMLI